MTVGNGSVLREERGNGQIYYSAIGVLAAMLFADTSVYFIAMSVGLFCLTRYIVTYLDKNSLKVYLKNNQSNS